MIKKLTIISLFIQLLSLEAWSQAETESDFMGDSIVDISTVAAIGAAGAVLGLSTLSFVEEPKDHLKNILVGGSIGIIIGVGVVAFRQAGKSKDQYYSGQEQAKVLPNFNTFDRFVWHRGHHLGLNKEIGQFQSHIQYGISF